MMLEGIGVKLEEYPELIYRGQHISPYGTADDCLQVHNKIISKINKIIKKTGRMFIIEFDIIMKEHQPPVGGWRWHKWGPYIGKNKPQYEYLYDEKGHDLVLLWHIKEIIKEEM